MLQYCTNTDAHTCDGRLCAAKASTSTAVSTMHAQSIDTLFPGQASYARLLTQYSRLLTQDSDSRLKNLDSRLLTQSSETDLDGAVSCVRLPGGEMDPYVKDAMSV